jgi:hypothetical protein
MGSVCDWDIFGIKEINASSIAALNWCCNFNAGKIANNRVSISSANAEFGDSRCGVGIYFYADETGALVIRSLDSEGILIKRLK